MHNEMMKTIYFVIRYNALRKISIVVFENIQRYIIVNIEICKGYFVRM